MFNRVMGSVLMKSMYVLRPCRFLVTYGYLFNDPFQSSHYKSTMAVNPEQAGAAHHWLSLALWKTLGWNKHYHIVEWRFIHGSTLNGEFKYAVDPCQIFLNFKPILTRFPRSCPCVYIRMQVIISLQFCQSIQEQRESSHSGLSIAFGSGTFREKLILERE